ncbi:MAG: alpha/beta hydrolase [bacterium]
MPTATVNGVNLNYNVRGDGPPLVLLHGFTASGYVWEPAQEFLAARAKVFTLDIRGHGDSEKPPGPYSIQGFADDLLALLNFLGLDKVDLMGHSMGGRTALLFALGHGDRLSRLMLVGASGAPPKGEFRDRFLTLKRVAAEEGVAAVRDHPLVASVLPRSFTEGAGGEAHRARYMKNTPEGIGAICDAVLNMEDLTGRLGEIETPAWVCVGENERPGQAAFSKLCEERIPVCTRAVVAGSGHFPMQDNIEGFQAALAAFLDKIPVT